MKIVRSLQKPRLPEKIFLLGKDAAVPCYSVLSAYSVEHAERVRQFNLPAIGFVLIAVKNSRHEQTGYLMDTIDGNMLKVF